MTSQTQKTWRRALTTGIAGTGLAVAMAFGSAATAHADILDDLGQQYMHGEGAGPLSTLLEASLQLRSQGYKPRPADLQGIQDSLKYKPNQTPLINALKSTLSYQQKLEAQMTPQSSGAWTIGINQSDPGNPTGGGFGVSGPGGGGIGIGGG